MKKRSERKNNRKRNEEGEWKEKEEKETINDKGDDNKRWGGWE